MNIMQIQLGREHALATALRIDQMIQEGIRTRDNLISLFGLDGQLPGLAGSGEAERVILPPLADLDEAQATLPVPARPATPAAEPAIAVPREAGVGKGQGWRTIEPKVVSQIGKLPEPFTRHVLATHLGRTVQSASDLLTRMKDKGWVETRARGLWNRTRTYGENV